MQIEENEMKKWWNREKDSHKAFKANIFRG
jgi:hypothetical protein